MLERRLTVPFNFKCRSESAKSRNVVKKSIFDSEKARTKSRGDHKIAHDMFAIKIKYFGIKYDEICGAWTIISIETNAQIERNGDFCV